MEKPDYVFMAAVKAGIKMERMTVSIVLYQNSIIELTAVIKSVLSTDIKLCLVDNFPTNKLKDFVEKDNRIQYI